MPSASEPASEPAANETLQSLPAQLIRRYKRLFSFYDRDGDGLHTLNGDFEPVAARIAARWRGRPTPFPQVLQLLLDTYRHENERRDHNHDGQVSLKEFVTSHRRVFAAFRADPASARAFIARSAGGFFDLLDLDGDGRLDLDDLSAFAAAYGHPTDGIAANLAAMLTGLGLTGLPPDQLPRQAFLTLVEQYWFDPSPQVPGRLLFDGLNLPEPEPLPEPQLDAQESTDRRDEPSDG
jgi:hypothetical protein